MNNKVLKASLGYFGLVFGTGFLLGPPRVLFLEPRMGKTWAVLCEAPFLLTSMWFASRASARWANIVWGNSSGGVYVGMGLMGLVWVQVAEISVGVFMRNMSMSDIIAKFSTPDGLVYASLLTAFAAIPSLQHYHYHYDTGGSSSGSRKTKTTM